MVDRKSFRGLMGSSRQQMINISLSRSDERREGHILITCDRFERPLVSMN